MVDRDSRISRPHYAIVCVNVYEYTFEVTSQWQYKTRKTKKTKLENARSVCCLYCGAVAINRFTYGFKLLSHSIGRFRLFVFFFNLLIHRFNLRQMLRTMRTKNAENELMCRIEWLYECIALFISN